MIRIVPTLAAAAVLTLIPAGIATAAAQQPAPDVEVDLCVDVDAAIDAGDTRLVDLDTDLRARIAAALDATDDLTDDTALAAVRLELGCSDPTDPDPTTTPPVTTTPAPPTSDAPTTEPTEPTTTDPAPTTTDQYGDTSGGGYSQLDDVPTGAAETGGGPA